VQDQTGGRLRNPNNNPNNNNPNDNPNDNPNNNPNPDLSPYELELGNLLLLLCRTFWFLCIFLS